jgi:hypothetical protein
MKVATALVALLLLATGAQGADEPVAFASAHIGTLSVTSGIFVEPKAVGLRGVWQDTALPCTVNRRLWVHAVVDFVPAGRRGRAVARTAFFKDANCAEGGPNVGFQLSAKTVGFACPNGTWRPARYNFLTQATEPKRHLTATASLIWIKRGRC